VRRLLPVTRLAPLVLLVLAACARETSGPAEVAWDRDACERCQMLIADTPFAAQVRSAPGGRAHRFDDLGCALLWWHEHGADPRAEIWVRDLAGGQWIDARTARFRAGEKSPMGYGIGASAGPAGGDLALESALERILARERERRSDRG